MNIVVNAVPMAGTLTGIARYLRNLYARLEQVNGVSVSYFNGHRMMPGMPCPNRSAGRRTAARIMRALPAPLSFGARAVRWYLYEHRLNQAVSRAMGSWADRNGCPPVVHHETGFTPARLTRVPTLFSLYDLSLRRYRETQPRERVMLFDYFMEKRLAHADHILTISGFVRREIMDEFKIPGAMVSSVHLAADPLFSPAGPGPVRETLDRYGLPGEYLLFVSSLEPRKNIGLLVDAMAQTRTSIPLVLAGWQGWGEKPWLATIKDRGLKNRIYFTGHLPDHDLKHLYSGARALVYPSLYEGFGLPILEAMACGCPVICANAASMPEVAGDAARLIDPLDAGDLASAIDEVVLKEDLRAGLVERGLSRTAGFTWEKTAAQTLEIFKKVAP